MASQLDELERHGEFVDGVGRYLNPAKATDKIRGKVTTKSGSLPLLRSSIKVRKADDEVEAEPGFLGLPA